MVTIDELRQWSLALPGVVEMDHFGMPSFRVKGKIFSTYHEKDNKAMLKLTLIDQSVYCGIDKTIIYAVPGAWGRQGATFVTLKKIKKQLFREALQKAWANVAPKKGVNNNL